VTALVLLDATALSDQSDCLAPITTARPLAEVRVGARLVRERWAYAFGQRVEGIIAASRFSGFDEPNSAPVLADEVVLAPGTIVALSAFAPALQRVDTSIADTWMYNGTVVASVTRGLRVADIRHHAPPAGSRVASLSGWQLQHAWDVIGHLPSMLHADAMTIASELMPPRPLSADVRVLGDFPVRVAETAVIEPFVVFDASQGAIVIEANAVVRSFSRITGPFVLGADSQWMGGSGHTVSVGDHCKVNGEVSTTIVCGHANKGHDGFVGHSYLGRWVNLGAGTTTSNLKNTYGPVSFAGAPTGLQFLGSLMGDHAKTGIGTRLTTGSCIGAGANVISDDVVPNVVPPFAFGQRGELYEKARFLSTAERAMARRKVEMSESMRGCLDAVYGEAIARGRTG
jgi:UDP-N-acetylglucosamine diphosphorylase / glucose-1-phosphate thymidylyltransferase / UDP-N-acetylgalactosamine diphosphorylase / glucosamine-1-phosphate N-acetyltransferase / galactosamine-1-phosphate N-acetyltransferase